MAAAAILTITLVPVLVGYFVRGKIIPELKNPINRFLHFIHSPVLMLAMRWRAVNNPAGSAINGIYAIPVVQNRQRIHAASG